MKLVTFGDGKVGEVRGDDVVQLDAGSISGTSMRAGVPVGQGSIQVPALSVNVTVWLVLAK